MMQWPEAEIDAVTRLRSLSSGLPHVCLRERMIDAPFDLVWSIVCDLDVGLPKIEGGISYIDLVERRRNAFVARVHNPSGRSRVYQGHVGTGWCVLQCGDHDAGMAAIPIADPGQGNPERTLLAHYEGSRRLGRLGRLYFAPKIQAELRRLAALAAHPPENLGRRPERTLAWYED